VCHIDALCTLGQGCQNSFINVESGCKLECDSTHVHSGRAARRKQCRTAASVCGDRSGPSRTAQWTNAQLPLRHKFEPSLIPLLAPKRLSLQACFAARTTTGRRCSKAPPQSPATYVSRATCLELTFSCAGGFLWTPWANRDLRHTANQ
jgi:hypothetical protein